jgi:outer membrane autotransporter protein
MNSLPESINYAQNGDSGIAAGDAYFTKYGVWISPFYQRASQKQRVGELGYTGKSYGATIGADSMISDNCTVGVAWSNLNLKLTHSDSKVGGHSKVDSNILSLYGLMNLTKETFITSVASLGFSKVHNKETRQITTRLKQTASGKYDSRLYALQVLGGKAIKIANNFTITPLAGIRYTSFHDKGYTETGASIQNLSISKRSSSDIEAVIGTKLAATYNLNGYQLIPELSGSMNINLMNKVPVSYIMNPAFSNPIRLEGAKTTSAWYGVGSKLGIVKNAMEYGIAYEAQLATKYISHQGVLNMRVNF